VQQYEVILRSYFVRISRVFSVLLNITIISCRYACLFGKATKLHKNIIGIYILFSLLYNLPVFLFKILPLKNRFLFQIIVASMQLLLHIFALCVIIPLTVILIQRIRKQLTPVRKINNKLNQENEKISGVIASLIIQVHLDSENKSICKNKRIVRSTYGENLSFKNIVCLIERTRGIKLTIMIVLFTLVFIFDHISVLSAIILYLFYDSGTELYHLRFFIIHIGITISCSLNIIIYFKFNRNFSKHMRKILKTKFSGNK
jgi:hypothetical protein